MGKRRVEATVYNATRKQLYQKIRVQPGCNRVITEVWKAVQVTKGLSALYVQLDLPSCSIQEKDEIGGDPIGFGCCVDNHVLDEAATRQLSLRTALSLAEVAPFRALDPAATADT